MMMLVGAASALQASRSVMLGVETSTWHHESTLKIMGMTNNSLAFIEEPIPADLGPGLPFRFESIIPVFSGSENYIVFLHDLRDWYKWTEADQLFWNNMSSGKITCSDPGRTFVSTARAYGGENDVAYKSVLALHCPWPADQAPTDDCVEVVLMHDSWTSTHSVCHNAKVYRQFRQVQTASCVTTAFDDGGAGDPGSGHVAMPQWLEFNLMQGSDHFLFYTCANTPEWYYDVINVYLDRGFASRIHVNISCTQYDHQNKLVNDCLYRMKGRSKWLMPAIDFDEYIKLEGKETLQGKTAFAFDEVVATHAKLLGEAHGISFGRYNFKQPDNIGDTKLSSTLRQPFLAPLCPKYVARTDMVFTLFIHWPTSWRSSSLMLHMPSSEVVAHHYRTLGPDDAPWNTTDTSLSAFSDDVLARLRVRFGMEWPSLVRELSMRLAPKLSVQFLSIRSSLVEQDSLSKRIARSAPVALWIHQLCSYRTPRLISPPEQLLRDSK